MFRILIFRRRLLSILTYSSNDDHFHNKNYDDENALKNLLAYIKLLTLVFHVTTAWELNQFFTRIHFQILFNFYLMKNYTLVIRIFVRNGRVKY